MPGNYGMCCGPRVEEELIAPRAFLFEFCRDPGSANYEPLIAAIDSCGWWWWPFRESVILLERPSEIHRDEQSYLHKTDGPALVFRDGTSSHFWHGLRVDPEALVDDSRLAVSIRRAQLANYVHENEQRRNELIGLFGRDEYEDALQRGRAVRPKVDRESRLFKGPLPTLDALKSHGKPLFLYERYIAGDRRRVWEELVAAGSQVRQDGLAADALAVTVETMTRVRRNVEIVAERLKTLRYRFLGKSFVPARGGAAKKVAQLERAVGPMPLSLRAFYELVGDVDFMGGHKRLNPRGPDADATPDPLVVEPLDYVLSEFERNKADVQYEAQFLISMSPDDLTKQGDSGGFPYSIAIPNLGADGELLNASFHGTFVEYLRLAFEWGGFPGWEGDDGAPMEEINQLREGLLPF